VKSVVAKVTREAVMMEKSREEKMAELKAAK
jgi:hypothetical protein